VKAIILSAGQGKRLLPLTESLPKCLVDLGQGYTALSWQLTQLEKAGIDEAVVVTGFQADKVDQEVAAYNGKMTVRTLFNPFYMVADNLSSVWVARHEMDEDFMIINGDTMFVAPVAAKLIQSNQNITLTISEKGSYDDDDMKVCHNAAEKTLQRVGKKLDESIVNGESIGMMMFRNEGRDLFKAAADKTIREENGLKVWYLSVLDLMAQAGHVNTCCVDTSQWCEIDFPADYEEACSFAEKWSGQSNCSVSAV
jgi:choline kinase